MAVGKKRTYAVSRQDGTTIEVQAHDFTVEAGALVFHVLNEEGDQDTFYDTTNCKAIAAFNWVSVELKEP